MAIIPMAPDPSRDALPQTSVERNLFMSVEHCVESARLAQIPAEQRHATFKMRVIRIFNIDSLRMCGLTAARFGFGGTLFLPNDCYPCMWDPSVTNAGAGVHSDDFVTNSYHRSKQ